MPLALLEHVNLNVPDHDAAYAFYVTALGGVVNPKTTNERQLHVNVGASQFHLLLQASFAEGIEKVTIPQVWAGHIELWSREPLETIQQRLTEAGRSFTREEASAASGGKPHLLAVCPWGNRYLVRTAPDGFNAEAHGSHPGGIGGLIAITRCVQLVRPGSASRLHTFWSTALGASSELNERQMPSGGTHAHCIVRFNSGQQLIFDEREDAPPADAYDTEEKSAYHLAVYCDHVDSFKHAFSACEALDVLYANPRFARSPPEFGNAMEWELVQSCGQFRIKDMGRPPSQQQHQQQEPSAAAVDVTDGGGSGAGSSSGVPAAALVLELEIRSVSHVSCPLTRADIVAGGATVPVAPAFANCSPLKPPPHQKPGVIRIPHGRGGFGTAAKELASSPLTKK